MAQPVAKNVLILMTNKTKYAPSRFQYYILTLSDDINNDTIFYILICRLYYDLLTIVCDYLMMLLIHVEDIGVDIDSFSMCHNIVSVLYYIRVPFRLSLWC